MVELIVSINPVGEYVFGSDFQVEDVAGVLELVVTVGIIELFFFDNFLLDEFPDHVVALLDPDFFDILYVIDSEEV